jgi:hypothetical protein
MVESPVLVLVDLPDSDKDVGYKSKLRQRLSSSSQSGSDADFRRYWVGKKPGPLSSKPGMSKTIVKPSTSEAIVEPITSEAIVQPSTRNEGKRPRLEVHDLNLLCDSSSPKRRRVTRARMDEEEAIRKKAGQANEV